MFDRNQYNTLEKISVPVGLCDNTTLQRVNSQIAQVELHLSELKELKEIIESDPKMERLIDLMRKL